MEVIKRVYEVLNEKKVDGIFVSDMYNMRYISGFTSEDAKIFITKNKKFLFTDFRYYIQAEKQTKGYEIIDNKDMYKTILLQNCKTIGFENKSISYDVFDNLKKELSSSDITFVNLDESLDELRKIKSEYELECIKKAESIGDIAFSKVLDYIKPGLTEKEIAAYIEYTMKLNGAEKTSFDTIVASGVNSSMPHAVVSDKKIEKGDFVTMDFGCMYEGYCSDMTRTIVVGKASDKQIDVYNTVLKAQVTALDNLKAGVDGKAIDKIARDIIDNAGYKGMFGHSLGHSVGLYIHESPVMSPLKSDILKEGHTITVEPGIYIKDFGGVRIEDLVAITKDGYVNFTNSEKKLIEI